jgi:hypothetical protein
MLGNVGAREVPADALQPLEPRCRQRLGDPALAKTRLPLDSDMPSASAGSPYVTAAARNSFSAHRQVSGRAPEPLDAAPGSRGAPGARADWNSADGAATTVAKADRECVLTIPADRVD